LPVDGSSATTARALAQRGFAVERRPAPGGGTLLACTGELDLATVPAFEDALCDVEADSEIVLDLSGLDFMDCRGLAMVLALHRRVRECGGHVTIVRGPDAVNRVFEITGLLDQFDFVDHSASSNGAPRRVGERALAHSPVRSAA
jgi:anti-sigma B factor antagonist